MTKCIPIHSVIIRMILTKMNDRETGVRFVNHEYDFRPIWTTRSPVTIFNWTPPGPITVIDHASRINLVLPSIK